jgi:beta-lactamase regulating signal transducer with metallopeptidase domain
MTMPITFALLFDSAVRAALLGAGVWALLRLARVRDTRAEITIWTAVLIASICMPLLCQALPGSVVVPLPSLHIMAPSAPALGVTLVSGAQHSVPGFAAATFSATRMAMLLWAIYGVVVALSLARLATGLILTLRLYQTATSIAAPWTAGRAIRASAEVSCPISFGSCILLPSDYGEWSEAKLLAVLAHEQSHIRRGDFFIQLLAALHRALFWFSSFAWWLQRRLCELAEAASDDAAARLLNDRASYAEILIDVSRCAHGIPAQVAMAKGPNIHWRIDRILGEAPERNLSLKARLLAVCAILPAACLLAGAHAAVAPTPAAARPPILAQTAVSESTVISAATPAARPPAAVRHARTVKTAGGHPRANYNPRALLENNDAVIVPALIPTGAKGTKKKSGDAAVILNMNSLAGSGD